MDLARLDSLSRHLAGNAPRRTLLGGLLGALVANATQPAADARKRKKKRCKPPRRKCGKKCLVAGACCTNADCTAVIGQVCVGNACECPGGQVAAGNTCAVPCKPACGDCQRCDDGVCGDVADDTPCPNGGKCQAGVCRPDRAFGCTAAQNTCAGGSGTACPDSTTAQAFCFIAVGGDSICGTAKCSNATTDEACATEIGSGAISVPCPPCGLGGKTHMCVLPVSA